MKPFGKLYNSLKIIDAWDKTDDLTVYTQWGLDTTNLAGQVVPLIFNPSQKGFSLNIQAVPGNIGAYPFLRRLNIVNQKDPAYRQINATPVGINNTITFPASSTTTQTTNFTFIDQVKKILFNTVPVGITVTDIQIGQQGFNNFVDLFPASFTAGGTAFDLESYFGTLFGASDGQIANGFTVKVTATNANGTSSNVNLTLFGSTKTFQNSTWLIDYQDAHGTLHRIGVFDDSQIGYTFDLNRLVTVPITDPTTPNFGTLLFTLLRSNHPFYTMETYDIVMDISIAYLLTEGA